MFEIDLLCALYLDVAGAFPAQHSIEFERDLKTVRSRAQSEGIAFFTKTLPSLAKAVDRSLASGDALQVRNFARRRGSKLPRFLGWLFEQIFDDAGLERLDASPVALKYLRQILYLFYKTDYGYPDELKDLTINQFVECDKNLPSRWDLDANQAWAVRTAAELIENVLGNTNPFSIVPGHGPGAVATGERSWEKPYFKRFYPKLHAVFPYEEHMFYSLKHVCARWNSSCPGYSGMFSTEQEGLARVQLVPKDSRGPRIISMEPLEFQWIQQGLKRALYATIELHFLTRGRVNFVDQTVNQKLALESSLTGDMVTIDMKEASDRVSLLHLHCLFPGNWIEALEACRSSGTKLPDGRVVQLNKFAPMGSAVCFPVEALVFWALSVACLMRYSNWQTAVRQVYVYGDDIILPRKDFARVIQLLEATGLLVNRDKCCVGRSFRESCGVDAFKGIDVTPIKLRRPLGSLLGVRDLFGLVSVANEFHQRGLIRASTLIRTVVNNHSKMRVKKGRQILLVSPCVPSVEVSDFHSGSCVFERHYGLLSPDPRLGYVAPRFRWNRQRFVRQILVWGARPYKRQSKDTDYEILLDRAVQSEIGPRSDEPSAHLPKGDYLLRQDPSSAMLAGLYPIRRRVAPKRRWTDF